MTSREVYAENSGVPTKIVRLEALQSADVSNLVEILDEAWSLEACQDEAIPNLAPDRWPDGLANLPVGLRKQAFIRSLLPHILDANVAIAEDRAVLQSLTVRLAQGAPLDETQCAQILTLCRRYRIRGEVQKRLDEDPSGLLGELLLRADRIPPSLALAQAALESAWGTSRFAVEGNSLFGQWVFSARKGMAPKDRPQGAQYSVARFDTLRAAVVSYMRNLNTSWAYADLRQLRAQMNHSAEGVDSLRMADGLLLYSARRAEYVEEVRQVIRDNRLSQYDDSYMCSVELAERSDPLLPITRQVAASETGKSLPPDA